MTTTTETTAETTTHAFEKAGLGKAPFRCTGVRENRFTYPDGTFKAGGCCCYCSTGILNEYVIRSADGRVFVVGSECVRKTGDAGLVRVVKAEEAKARKAQAAARKAREAARVVAAFAAFDTPEGRAVLAARPHPMGFVDRQTGQPLTLADQIDWTRKNAGHTGRLEAARMIEKALNLK